MTRKNVLPGLLIAAISAITGIVHAGETPLPDIGSSAGTVASPEEQRQYGFYMLHELRNQNVVLEDELLNDYINTLGFRLVAYSPKPDQPFTFFLVRDTQINAFAVPGGFVGVNAGLILMTRSEDELAAVLAHEVSHITQNHLIRAVEAEQKMTPLMVLAMIGALAAAAHQNPYSTSNADMGAIATVQGLAAQMQINFTRADEVEADRIGINTLAKANFDPEAMADVFENMQRAIRPTFDENDVPALLQDHPVTTERISEARARAAVIKKAYKPSVVVGDVEDARKANGENDARKSGEKDAAVDVPLPGLLPKIDPNSGAVLASLAETPESRGRQRMRSAAYFLLMRERVRVLSHQHPAESIRYYTDDLRNTQGFDTPANRYGLALALIQGGRAKEAIEPLEKLARADPENLVYQLALGDAELYAGQRDAALQRYARLEKNFPDNRTVVLAHTRALLFEADKNAAHNARELLRPQLSHNDEDPLLYTAFGQASDMMGDKVRAGESYAIASYLNGRAEDALNQLKDLAKRTDLDYYQRKRIEALIEQMTPLVLDLRRHKIKPADQGKFESGFSACFSAACAGPS
ncbi:MAG TPA: M48 family metalloprotease [Rhodanobacteraceae bacterium]|nr:M48 family metalloprotease [Rhodanobacteraceae bacterium]